MLLFTIITYTKRYFSSSLVDDTQRKNEGHERQPIMVLLFSFEEINIITAIIYGIPNTSDEAGLLLRNLFEIIEEIYLKIKSTQPNTILFMAGDFNSFSFQRNEDFYWGKSRQANQSRSLYNRPKKVMQDLESNKDLNLIHLWDISKKNLGDKYFTAILLRQEGCSRRRCRL